MTKFTTWTPDIVIPTSSDTKQTAENAKALLEKATMEEISLDEVRELLAGGWLTWEDGALVQWIDGEPNPDGIARYNKYVLTLRTLTPDLLTQVYPAEKARASDLIFQHGSKTFIVRNAKIYLPDDMPTESSDFEIYWDDENNIIRAIAEAEEVEAVS